MKKLLVLGAGRSSYSLIRYLLSQSVALDWHVRVGDQDPQLAAAKIAGHPRGEAFEFDVYNPEQCEQEIMAADMVISLLPASLHYLAARYCVQHGRHLVNASYVSPDMRLIHENAQHKGVLLLNEMGLDPGIDHLSAKQTIDHLHAQGARITSFKSYTGGLIAPESDDNPWHYKFTWNPRNVVMAGQGTAKYIENGEYKYLPYHRLFKQAAHIQVDGFGEFDGYANRDSLQYRELYGLQHIPTMLRGTLRRKGYCKSWDTFVQLGMTDDSYKLERSEEMTFRDYVNAFLPYDPKSTVEQKVAQWLGVGEHDEEIRKLSWLGLFDTRKTGLPNASPAQILQKLLEEKWVLGPEDKDMIVMQHIFEYELEGKAYTRYATLVVIGTDSQETAMAKTVGLPLGIAARLIAEGRIKARGVVVPVIPEIYQPVLQELSHYGITFHEKDVLNGQISVED